VAVQVYLPVILSKPDFWNVTISTQHSGTLMHKSFPSLVPTALQIPFAFIAFFLKELPLIGIFHVKHAVFLYLAHQMYKKQTESVLQGKINKSCRTIMRQFMK